MPSSGPVSITFTALVILFGAYALVDGVFNIIAGIRAVEHRARWGLLMLQGAAGIGIGVVTWFWPGLTALALLYLLGAWSLIIGVFELANAVKLHDARTEAFLLSVAGVLSILFGLVLFLFPISGALAVIWLIGAYALLFGLVLLWLAYRLHAQQHGGDSSSGIKSEVAA